MAQIRDRAPAPGEDRFGTSATSDTLEEFTSTEGRTILGASETDVEQNPQQFIGELFKGAHFNTLNVPSSAVAGGTVTVTGNIHFDSPTTQITTVGMRVRVVNTSTGEERIQRFQNIQHCNDRDFAVEMPIPARPGSEVAFKVYGESTNLTGGWQENDVRGPFRIALNTSSQERRQDLIQYAPWAVAGGGAGLLTASVRDSTNRAGYALGGAGVGVGARLFLGNEQGTGGNIIPDIDPLPVLAIGAGLAGAGFFLQSTGAGGVLSGAGEAAGSAIRGAADRVRDR